MAGRNAGSRPNASCESGVGCGNLQIRQTNFLSPDCLPHVGRYSQGTAECQHVYSMSTCAACQLDDARGQQFERRRPCPDLEFIWYASSVRNPHPTTMQWAGQVPHLHQNGAFSNTGMILWACARLYQPMQEGDLATQGCYMFIWLNTAHGQQLHYCLP